MKLCSYYFAASSTSKTISLSAFDNLWYI